MKNYSNWSKDELVRELEKIGKVKKYGLVWEDKPENVVVQCKKELPILVEVKDKAIEKDKTLPTNIFIEGDNYHALSVLNYTHAGKIDAIYADPPYNTGAKNWIYNNHFVDGNDGFRHSKWLSFMDKRLRLAKSLLKNDGIIVVTIDDNEIATLNLLMDEIFGEENYLGTIVIKNNPQGRSNVSGFQISHEYALFYGKTRKAKIGRLPRTQEQINRYKESDAKGPFEWRNFRAQYSTESPKMKYPIFVKKDCSDFRIPNIKWNKEKQSYDLMESPDNSEIISLPVDPDGRERTWKWSIETVQEVKDTEMGVRLDIDKKPSVYYKGRMKDDDMLPYTIWDKPDYSASSMGTNLLSAMNGVKKFDYPKSLYAVADCLRVLSSNKEGVFLDFFAGSGTTGHAALMLNKADGGNRKFILCTNNENKIAEDVCFPRIKNVIEGDVKLPYITGIRANVRYFKTDFVDAAPTDKNKRKLVDKSTEMLCLKEDCFHQISRGKNFRIFNNNQEKHLGIIYDDDGIDSFKSEAKRLNQKFIVYVFSLDDSAREEEFEDVVGLVELRPIPEVILNVYRRIFK